ncbi:MAG TPA: hypothetical protein GX695_05470 [Acholeplasmataceae bacterium]|nr:hypothetical protein [Acholeplasmataceae bacterium]
MTFRKTSFYILGIISVATGIAALLKASLGLTSIDASCYGLSELTGLTVGQAAILFNLALILLGSLIKFNTNGLISIGVTLVFGVTVDLFIWIFSFITGTAFVGTLITASSFFIGTLFIPMGAAMMVYSGFPTLAGEVLLVSFKERFKISDGLSKFLLETFLFILAVVICIIADILIEDFKFFNVINHYTIFLYLSASFIFPKVTNKLKGGYLYVQQIN